MSFSPDFIATIKSRVNLSDLITARVKLTRRGRTYQGLCPFHSEKSPSFHVDDERGTYHCFGCSAHGDAISFLTDLEKLTFSEAVERLAGLAGVEMPRESTFVSPAQAQEKKTLEAVLKEAQVFFQETLKKRAGEQALAYLETRGVSLESRTQFGLGYAPAGSSLSRHLLTKGYAVDLLEKAGLAFVRDDSGDVVDRFRDRLMFPICDRRGVPIGFGGRLLKPGEPKYLNSPDSDLFHKGRILYAHHIARPQMRANEPLIVAEGYMDVLALHQAGFTGAVAPMGTALTEDQLILLWQMRPEPIFCFDGDLAGQKAAHRTAVRALPLLKPGHSVSFILLPQGEDPDSLLKAGGASKLRDLLATPVALVEILWRAELAQHPTQTPEQKALLEKTLFKRVSEIKDNALRTLYWQAFKDKLRQHFQGSISYQSKQTRKSSAPLQSLLDRDTLCLKILMATLLNHPSLMHDFQEEFAALEMTHPHWIRLREAMLEKINDEPDLDTSNLHTHLYTIGFDDAIRDVCVQQVYVLAPFARVTALQEDAANGWRELWGNLMEKRAQTDEKDHIKATLSQDLTQEVWDAMKRSRMQN